MNHKENNLDSLTAEQVGKLFPIRIEPYDPEWKTLFGQEKELITEVLGTDLAVDIEHIGSTSVEGLDAKPTIDILVEVPNLSIELKHIIARKLETAGYGNMSNSERENRMTFGKGYERNCPHTYHIHIMEKGNTPQDEIYFRDSLRENPCIRDEYKRLKYRLAEKYRFNREEYTQAKTEFIVRTTEQQKQKKYDCKG